MTLLKDRLEKAGAITAESRLAALTVSALQESHSSVDVAVEALWKKLSAESWIVKEMFLRPYVAERHRDMRGSVGETGVTGVAGCCRAPAGVAQERVAKLDSPQRRVASPERKQAVAKIVEKAVQIIRFKCTTSDGRDWAQVHAYELGAMDRDGALARAIKERLGALSNSQTNKPIGELMTAAVFNDVRTTVELKAGA